MTQTFQKIAVGIGLVVIAVGTWTWIRSSRPTIDFSTQVKPILNKHCISCHGGVKKNGNFSLLFKEEAFAPTKSGKPAIIPGDPDASSLITRLHEKDPELRMPYKRAPLAEEEVEILRQWIKEGAQWGEHWAYQPVQKIENPDPTQNPVDVWVKEKQEDLGLKMAPREDKLRLLRRLSLDITGLPPSPALVKAWKEDKITYEKTVDQLLASSAYGEKWAAWWLDLARYADTKGYERDVSRTMWPYRDWVIQSLNQDLSFQDFTRYQLAGDLLPNRKEEHLIATAFHRNTMNNDEGGTDDEEFRVAAVLDRVNTTYEVWQSTTMACVQCHSHPYDPFRHEEFYRSYAFFNNSRDEDTHDEEPKLRFYSDVQKKQIAQVTQWVQREVSPTKAKEITEFLQVREPKYHAHLCTDFHLGELIDTKWLGLWSGGSARLPKVNTRGSQQILIHYWADVPGTTLTIKKGNAQGEVLMRGNLPVTQGRRTLALPLKSIQGIHDLHIEARNPKTAPQQSTAGIVWFAFQDPLPGAGKPGFEEVASQYAQLLDAPVQSLPVMYENPDYMARPSFVFERGNWMLAGATVKPETPKILNPWKKEWPSNRLGLANWLVDPQNPLTARTMVNRIWDQLFGRGLVPTLEDMGTQAELPSHPKLLDHLAYEWMHSQGWSLKKLIKTLVLSETYQQSSQLTPELFAVDPDNKWYARGPRRRLSAEQIRDQALAVSGLLKTQIGGAPVMPWQPEGIWQTVYNGESWQTSTEGNQHRRALYTFLKRTSPYPSFISFDAGSREVCLSKRTVTNTPLQALVTLNDPVYWEVAKQLALQMKKQADPLAFGYERCVLIPLSDAKRAALQKVHREALAELKKKPGACQKLVGKVDPDWAAYTVVANTILNLDEFLTKP
ncbi:MAG: PSD1 and planctomycete cytochrome C domain-containing protein [Spirosomataceae bacterium]